MKTHNNNRNLFPKMGVLRLFSYIYNKYPECIYLLGKYNIKETFETISLRVDSFELDLNALIHPICQKMYGYGTSTSKTGGLLKNKLKKQITLISPSEKEVFEKICREMENMCLIANPTKEIVICLDGVAGASKMCQQRQRRFRSTAENNGIVVTENIFDSNCITTGSIFMHNFSKYLHFYIERRIKKSTWWSSKKIVFSNHKVCGEGESKIMQYVKNNEENTHCIYSPDGDLIMYTLGIIKNQNMYILRENIYDFVKCKYFVVDIQKLKNSIVKNIKWTNITHEFNNVHACWDFIFITFMLGNDFLPHSPSLEIPNSGLDLLMCEYSKCGTEHGHLVNNNLTINSITFKKFLEKLTETEIERLQIKANQRMTYPDKLLLSCMNEGNTELDFERYRKLYYEKHFDKNFEIRDVCKKYFQTLQFVILYYMNGMPDWQFFYPYHYSPLLIDLVENFEMFNPNQTFDIHHPLSPYEQLLSVLPKKSKALLPLSLQHLMNEDSDISKFFPTNIEMDCDGVRQEYEFKVLVNFVDIKKIQDVYKMKRQLLSESEKEINKFGHTFEYKLVNNNIVKIPFNIFK